MAASGSCRTSVTVGVSIEYAEDVDGPGQTSLLDELEPQGPYRLSLLDRPSGGG